MQALKIFVQVLKIFPLVSFSQSGSDLVASGPYTGAVRAAGTWQDVSNFALFKAFTIRISWLKEPTSAFTFKTK